MIKYLKLREWHGMVTVLFLLDTGRWPFHTQDMFPLTPENTRTTEQKWRTTLSLVFGRMDEWTVDLFLVRIPSPYW